MLWFMLLYMSVVGVVSGLSRAELANFCALGPTESLRFKPA